MFSCTTLKENYNKNEKIIIIKTEIDRQLLSISNDSNKYLSFKLNSYLENYLSEVDLNNIYSEFVLTGLTKKEKENIFNDKEIKYLIKQLKIIDVKYDEINYPEKIILDDLSNVDRLNKISKCRIYLSNPIILKNKNYAIIVASSGYENEMQGSINLYKKNNNSWEFYTRVESWIE